MTGLRVFLPSVSKAAEGVTLRGANTNTSVTVFTQVATVALLWARMWCLSCQFACLLLGYICCATDQLQCTHLVRINHRVTDSPDSRSHLLRQSTVGTGFGLEASALQSVHLRTFFFLGGATSDGGAVVDFRTAPSVVTNSTFQFRAVDGSESLPAGPGWGCLHCVHGPAARAGSPVAGHVTRPPLWLADRHHSGWSTILLP